MLPFYGGFIGQGPGINADGTTIVTFSHDGYRAIDVTPTNKLVYAPCKVKCVYHDRISYTDGYGQPCQSSKLAVFTTVEKVKCPEFESVVTFLFTHGGEVIPTEYGNLEADDTIIYNTGDLIYKTGTDGGIVNNVQQYIDEHVHINVMLGTFSNFDYVGVNRYIVLPNDINIERVCFRRKSDNITINSYYKLPTFIIADESGQWNGWIADGEYWYYYDKGAKVTGWLRYPSTSSNWYYLDPNNEGKMVTGWLLIDGLYYYFNPKDGSKYHIAGLAGGQMVRSHWIADGSKWYYVKESGVMAKSESLTINGKLYNFDSNGVCLNP